jgi:Mg2+ and Co2+ transporter CorA
MEVLEEIAIRIDRLDEKLMTDRQSLSLSTLHSIYHLKHDLLHLRILFNPLKEIISRLQRTIEEGRFLLFPRTKPGLRIDLKHHIVRRLTPTLRLSPSTSNALLPTTASDIINNSLKQSSRSSIYLNGHIYMYLNDLNDHINQLIDSLEIQRESVSALISFWITLNRNETEGILKILMLLSALFMPCLSLIGIYSTNFKTHPEYHYDYGYFIMLAVLGSIIIGMLTLYKIKQWI